MRINRFIASCIDISRRNADVLVKSGKVAVNGRIIRDFIDIDIENDSVEIEGQRLYIKDKKYYFAFYKPPFVLSANSDSTGKSVVCDYFNDINEKLICVGRLDYLSEGLLLVTNDGDFANTIMHPKFKIRKTYLIKTKNILNMDVLKKMSKGTKLDDGFFKPLTVKTTKDPFWVAVSIDTGRNRVLRRFFRFFDIDISKLKRIAIGNIELGGLKPGEHRPINVQELAQIKKI